MRASIVIRTYNEQRYLAELLAGIRGQRVSFDYETVLVDSGSTDRTVSIAKQFGCLIEHIDKEKFSFGRSLNIGCRAATGECLVFVSGHCIPATENWLSHLIEPLGRNSIAYTYGCQRGKEQSRYSECQIFSKYFPAESRLPQDGFYCNNANAAMLRSIWEQHPFDEELTGLEDMHLSKQLLSKGLKLGYVADAMVYHLHDESWTQIRRRFEREAIALQHIMPEIHLSLSDFIRYFSSAVLLDLGSALQKKILRQRASEIVMYRLMQFWGAYRGNHMHRRLSKVRKEQYFYPR